jgi:hypothetical protein
MEKGLRRAGKRDEVCRKRGGKRGKKKGEGREKARMRGGGNGAKEGWEGKGGVVKGRGMYIRGPHFPKEA